MKASFNLMYRIQKILTNFGGEEMALDETSRQILFQVANNQQTGQITTVSDITRQSHYGTAPTVYTRLKKLVELDLITSSQNPADGRSNMLQLTKRSERLIKAAENAVRAEASK